MAATSIIGKNERRYAAVISSAAPCSTVDRRSHGIFFAVSETTPVLIALSLVMMTTARTEGACRAASSTCTYPLHWWRKFYRLSIRSGGTEAGSEP